MAALAISHGLAPAWAEQWRIDRIGMLEGLRYLLNSGVRLNPLLWTSEKCLMERMLATPADAEIVLRLYQLRTEAEMRKARAWMTGEFWPATAEEFFAVSTNPGDPHSAWFRQVITYWEMAAAMVLHGAVSAELFVDCNAEGFFLLAKFAPILEAIREKNPGFLTKTSELINRFSAAAQRYEGVLKNVEARQKSRAAG
jgi:hypothetical protein